LADRYLQRAPCPAKHDAARPHAQRVLDQVRSSKAQGVIFVLPKFCDPHAFDYVPLAKALADAGVPHLLIETDLTMPASQLRTRIQAFIELLNDSVV
jgi:benzoyl-CoA reductase subunit C